MKVRVRGTAADVAAVTAQIGDFVDIANDSGDVKRRGFVDRYLEIVLDGVRLVDRDTGEIIDPPHHDLYQHM